MIADRARLPTRKIRYVVDQKMLPGLRGRTQAHLPGRPRSFTEMEGYFIACAAVLLEGGAQRRTVTEVLARLADMPWPPGHAEAPRTARQRVLAPPRTSLEAMYSARAGAAELLVGDGVNLRLRLQGVDTGWLEPRSLARLADGYRPAVTIQLDLAALGAFNTAGAGEPAGGAAERPSQPAEDD